MCCRKGVSGYEDEEELSCCQQSELIDIILVCVSLMSSLQAPAVVRMESKRKRGGEDPSNLLMGSYVKELEHVKERLKCLEHPGEEKWCWVDPTTPGAQHIPLCLHDIQLWVKYLVCKSMS
jgi:hypothetical protein